MEEGTGRVNYFDLLGACTLLYMGVYTQDIPKAKPTFSHFLQKDCPKETSDSK